MTGLDTNVLVQFLVRDDPAQGAQASDCVASLSDVAPKFIAREVMVETVWVLEQAYGPSRIQIAKVLERLLDARELVIETAERVAKALNCYAKGGAGLSELMIALAGIGAGCEVTVTFDHKTAQGPGMQLVRGQGPLIPT